MAVAWNERYLVSMELVWRIFLFFFCKEYERNKYGQVGEDADYEVS